jgi:phosphoglycolate phosphatase-like HAD superfamily hydrolase
MKPKVIIYDFDGVICDSVNIKTEAFIELYKGHGLNIQNKVKNYHVSHGGISRFEKIRYFQTELLNQPLDDKSLSLLTNRFADLVKEKVISSPYIKGAKEFIEKYTHGETLQFICTGTPESEIIEIIDRRGMSHLFSGIYGSPKTKEAIIKEILEQTCVKQNECVFFGDALTDYHAANAFDIPFIGVRSIDITFPQGTFMIDDFNDVGLKKIEL